MNCDVCFSSLEENSQPIKLTCSCVYCDDCICSWIITQSQELGYQVKEEIICMKDACKKPFKVETILDQFSQNHQEEIQKALLNVYLRKTSDIRQCPKPLCNYAGTIDLSSDCTEDLECTVCQSKWKEKQENSSPAKILELFKAYQDGNELSCLLWEEIRTKKCPQCNANIQKNGGCSHMTCKRCSEEFCWHCSQEYKKHRNIVCWINFIVKITILGMFIFHIFALSGLGLKILALIWNLFNGLLEVYSLNIFLYLVFTISPCSLNKSNDFISKITGFAPIVLCGLFVFGIYYFDAFYSICKIFFLQLGLALSGLVYFEYLGAWVSKVH